MTCIIGYRDTENKCVHIGADSFGGNDYTTVVREDKKIFHCRNTSGIIIAFTSSYRMGQLLMSEKALFSGMPAKYITHHLIVSKVVPRIIGLYEKNRYVLSGNNGERSGGSFLIGAGENLFSIEDDFQVAVHKDNFISLGAGSDYALGSLHTTETMKMEIQNKIHLALDASERFSPYVSRPFYILNTKNNNVEEIL